MTRITKRSQVSTATCIPSGECLFHTTIPCNLTCFSWPLDYSVPFEMRLTTKSKPAFVKKGNVLFLLMIKIALFTIFLLLGNEPDIYC